MQVRRERPDCPASTQKLLTALIVAETGFLDRPVTVQSVDTMCDPVKLGNQSGETYQRMDLLRALLVKSPNGLPDDVWRETMPAASRHLPR